MYAIKHVKNKKFLHITEEEGMALLNFVDEDSCTAFNSMTEAQELRNQIQKDTEEEILNGTNSLEVESVKEFRNLVVVEIV